MMERLEVSNMTVSDAIKNAIENSHVMQKDVAKHMGWTPQNFANRLRNNTIDADEWVKIARFLGYTVQMVRDEGEIPVGISEPVKQQVDCVTYNTREAVPVCHTSEFAGAFYELYRDPVHDCYFVVLNASWLEKGQIFPISDECAADFKRTCKYTGDL